VSQPLFSGTVHLPFSVHAANTVFSRRANEEHSLLSGSKGTHEVAVSTDGQTASAPIYGDSGVGKPVSDGRAMSVIDLKARKKIASIEFWEPSRPHCVVFNANDSKL